jgi:UDP-N-acetylglucosamine--N-acetylmuramyl-(pentapeptide) pyrophosphoryl-undecaprenol N-acetylglucosamine transferase
LAVAERLGALGDCIRITFAGAGGAMERRIVEQHGHQYVAFRCRAWPRRPWKMPHFALDYVAGVAAARRWLAKHPADVVVGLGGWSSVPMARAAHATRTPLVLLEQNALPGRVTRWLAPHAELVCAAMAEAQPWLNIRQDRFRHTGNPVRSMFSQRAAAKLGSRPPRLVVLGGSNGSADLNRTVPEAIARLGARFEQWGVFHQTGAAELATTRDRYAQRGRWATLRAFFPNVAELLADADVVISRAGGTTLAELAACGSTAIVVPYPHAADDHQLRNAVVYARHGACRAVDFRRATDPAGELADQLLRLAVDPRSRQKLREGMRTMAMPHAAAEVARLVRRIAERRIVAPSARAA